MPPWWSLGRVDEERWHQRDGLQYDGGPVSLFCVLPCRDAVAPGFMYAIGARARALYSHEQLSLTPSVSHVAAVNDLAFLSCIVSVPCSPSVWFISSLCGHLSLGLVRVVRSDEFYRSPQEVPRYPRGEEGCQCVRSSSIFKMSVFAY